MSEMSNMRIIDSLQAMEKSVLSVIGNSELRSRDKKKMVDATQEIYHLLHATFGKDILTATPSSLNHEQLEWVQDKISQYNFQLRLYYQGVFGDLCNQPGDNAFAALKTQLESACAEHSKQMKKLFDDCIPSIRTSMNESPTAALMMHERRPERRGNADEKSYSSGFNWSGGSWNMDCSLHHDFWYWNGFSDGMGSNPSLCKALFTNNYSSGFVAGRSVNAIGKLIRLTPTLARGVATIARSAAPIFSGALDAGVQLGGAAVRGVVSASQQLGNGCGSGICECISCMGQVVSAPANMCCSLCGALGSCRCDGGGDCMKIVCGGITFVGTLIINAGNKLFGKEPKPADVKPIPPPFNSTTLASTQPALMASFTTGYQPVDNVLPYIKTAWFSTLGLVMIPNHLFSLHKNTKNWCEGYKVTESKALIGGQVLGLVCGFSLGYLIPLGGPNVGYVTCLILGWAAPKVLKNYWNRGNEQLFGTKNPDKYRVDSDAEKKLEEALVQRAGNQAISPLQLQRVIQELAAAIEEETRVAKKTQNCLRGALYRLWGMPIVKTDELKKLEKTMFHLREGNLNEALRQSVYTSFDLISPLSQTAPQVDLVIEPSAPRTRIG